MPVQEVAHFSISRLEVLDPQGEVDGQLEPHLSAEELLGLYRAMMLAREADQRMLKLQRQGRLGTFAPSTGQEAATCGPVFAMEDRDWFAGTYRELGARLMRGESLEHTLLYYNGYEEGSRFPQGLRNLPTQVVLGAQLLHAVGLAFAMRQQGEEDTAVVAFFGDGATSQGDFHEALNFAAVWQVPVVFICQNNGWAISTPLTAQTRAGTIAQKAVAYGMPGVQVDGNDVLATYRATSEALARARSGGGPTLVEAVTYRLMMHTTADDPTKYRDEGTTKEWWERDPLVRMGRYLKRKGIWDDARQEELKRELKAQVDAEVKRFETPRDFKLDAPFDHVFGEPVPELERQRADFLRRLAEEETHA